MKRKNRVNALLACLPLLLAIGNAGAIDVEHGVSTIEARRFAYSLYGYSVADSEEVIPPVPSREELVKLLGQLDSQLERDETDPVLWLLKGAIHGRLLSERQIEMKASGMNREQRLANEQYIRLREGTLQAYRKALEVDGREDAKRHLNTRTLDIIASDVFSDASMRVPARRRQLERWKTDDDFDSNENTEFNMYGFIVSAYIDEKRHDEALGVIAEMQERFGSYESWAEEIAAARERITRDKAEMERQQAPGGM